MESLSRKGGVKAPPSGMFQPMSSVEYLQRILAREAVDTGPYSPVRNVQAILMPAFRAWAGNLLLAVSPSGSFAKGTANHSGTDIDLFLSLSEGTTNTLQEIYDALVLAVRNAGYSPRLQNVSVGVRVNGYDVDLVPAKRQNAMSQDHSLYRRKAGTWTKTNVVTHINTVVAARRTQEIRILKLWRRQNSLVFPSFYLELTVIAALQGATGSIDTLVWTALQYLRDSFVNARVVDPANTNNVISDDLTAAEKAAVSAAAARTLQARTWEQVVA